jgi:hypothetical protein
MANWSSAPSVTFRMTNLCRARFRSRSASGFCLAVNASGQPGRGYKANWEEEKERVAKFDWESCEQDWAMHVNEWRTAAQRPQKLVKRSREDAETEFMAHWHADAASEKPLYPNRLDNHIKEEILKALVKGHRPEDAFQVAVVDA